MWADTDRNYWCEHCLAVGYHRDDCPQRVPSLSTTTTEGSTTMPIELLHKDPCSCTIDSRTGAVIDYDCGRQAVNQANAATLPGDDDHRGPWLEETSPALIEQLTRLGQQYGPAGVARAARQLLNRAKNTSHRVAGDERPCTCSPGGLTWEADCPRHAELVATAVLPRRADRAWFCDHAKGLIGGDRQASYGDAGESFDRLARLWTEVIGTPVTAEQVALCLVQLKVSRLVVTPSHTDSWADIIGYAALGGEIAHR